MLLILSLPIITIVAELTILRSIMK
jgi:hypothetical protein